MSDSALSAIIDALVEANEKYHSSDAQKTSQQTPPLTSSTNPTFTKEEAEKLLVAALKKVVIEGTSDVVSTLKTEVEKFTDKLSGTAETIEDATVALKDEVEAVNEQLADVVDTINENTTSMNALKLALDSQLLVRVAEAGNQKNCNLSDKLEESKQDLKRGHPRLRDAAEVQSLYFKSSWEINYDTQYSMSKTHRDNALSAISIFIEDAAAQGKPFIAFRHDKGFGFQVFKNECVDCFSLMNLNVLSKLVACSDDINKARRELQLSETDFKSLQISKASLRMQLERLKSFNKQFEVSTSLNIFFNTDNLKSSPQVGLNWLKYTLLKSGYTVGSNYEWPLIINLRGNTTAVDKTFNLYQHSNLESGDTTTQFQYVFDNNVFREVMRNIPNSSGIFSGSNNKLSIDINFIQWCSLDIDVVANRFKSSY